MGGRGGWEENGAKTKNSGSKIQTECGVVVQYTQFFNKKVENLVEARLSYFLSLFRLETFLQLS